MCVVTVWESVELVASCQAASCSCKSKAILLSSKRPQSGSLDNSLLKSSETCESEVLAKLKSVSLVDLLGMLGQGIIDCDVLSLVLSFSRDLTTLR